MRWMLWIGACLGMSALQAETLHFQPGDAIPLQIKVEGDLLSAVGTPNLWLIVRQEYWIETDALLFSWDGVHWMDFEQFVGGQLHCTIGSEGAAISCEAWRK